MHMKLKTIMGLVLGIALIAPASQVWSNEGMKEGSGRTWDGAKMKKRLELTDDQVAKLKRLHESQKTAMKPLMEKQKSLREKLESLVKAKASDKDLQAVLDELKTNRKAIQAQREDFQAQKESIFTPTQRAKMVLARKDFRQGMHKRMMHHDEEKS